jgi:hypothetical protein
MKQGVTQPRADQPRASAKSVERGEQPANLQYRVEGIKSFTNRSPTRSYGRNVR